MKVVSKDTQKELSMTKETKEGTQTSEKEEEKNCDTENNKENGNASNVEDKDAKSPSTKRSKRIFPSFSLSRRKKEVGILKRNFLPTLY